MRSGTFQPRQVCVQSSISSLQIPDQFEQRAQEAYGNSDFVRAVELYSDAVDKLHTMYVMANPACAVRRPSQSDALITQGIVSAVAVALAMDSNASVRKMAERSIAYLNEIIALPHTGPVTSLYETAIRGLNTELQLSR